MANPADNGATRGVAALLYSIPVTWIALFVYFLPFSFELAQGNKPAMAIHSAIAAILALSFVWFVVSEVQVAQATRIFLAIYAALVVILWAGHLAGKSTGLISRNKAKQAGTP
jgi:hypothetical protein